MTMSDSKATPAAAPSDAPSAGPASPPSVDAVAVPAAGGEATAQSGAVTPNGTSSNAASTAATAAAASRKRVFTFQKRWLHTLPIMEKTLPESALDAASFAALKSANLVGEDGKPVDDANARDVIVCMLCDDPHSNRDVMKIWSRLNCRRGRIENHLMSKHPEFMLLLKQKREAEGDLAVQIFLQNMREGRCNVRSEISSGLYSNMQATLPPGAAHGHADLQLQTHKRTFGHDDFMMPAQAAAAVNVAAGVQYRTARDGADISDVENRRKRAKSHGNGREGIVATPVMLVNAPVPPSPAEPTQRGPLAAFGELLHAALISYVGPVGFAQWRSALTDKMVVITGGERPSIARAASNLWLMGANVLVTFADQESTEAFAASYLAQLHNSEGVEPPRGVMLPLFCSLHTRPQIDEWTRSIASKFEKVDFLINFVGEEDDPKKADAASLNDAARADRERSKSNADELISSSANRILEICQAFSSTCMQRGGRSAIVNITTQSDNVRTNMNCAAIEVMTKSLSNDLRSSQVQVNCIVLEQSVSNTSEASAEQELELLHTILFLLSPASTRISGSVIHQRRQEAAMRCAGSAVDSETATPQSEAPDAIDVVQNQVI